jgi:hypothetical protein
LQFLKGVDARHDVLDWQARVFKHRRAVRGLGIDGYQKGRMTSLAFPMPRILRLFGQNLSAASVKLSPKQTRGRNLALSSLPGSPPDPIQSV